MQKLIAFGRGQFHRLAFVITSSVGNLWILFSGLWNDEGEWQDDRTWKDEP